MRRIVLSLLLIAGLAGCTAGRDFTRPSPDQLALGESTESDILRLYGAPARRTSFTGTDTSLATGVAVTRFDPATENGTFAQLSYIYADRSGEFWTGAPASVKGLLFTFWNGRLVSYSFLSGFEQDSTNFDESKVSALKKGETTTAAARQLLGEPNGRAIYPIVQRRDDAKYLYSHVETTRAERKVKRLELLFGPDGYLADYRFTAESGPAPRPAPASAPMPIFIPVK